MLLSLVVLSVLISVLVRTIRRERLLRRMPPDEIPGKPTQPQMLLSGVSGQADGAHSVIAVTARELPDATFRLAER
jgi:hypothetical protein